MAGMSARRRRQRSVRVTIAVALLSAASLLVLAAVLTWRPWLLAAVSLLAAGCGWAACRITYSELRDTRRAHARERAELTRGFRDLFDARSREHAAFASAMTDRLATRDREVRELEGTLRLSERRAVAAEERARRETRRAHDAEQRVVLLEDALTIRRAEEADELASWPADDADTVVDLLAWEDRSQATAAQRWRSLRKRA